MSKKLPKYKRLFKQLKAGLIAWDTITRDDIELMKSHYPFLFR